MIRAGYIHRPLIFRRPAGTSRGILETKDCWYLRIEKDDGISGWGEVSFIPGLSPGREEVIHQQLDSLCTGINSGQVFDELDHPSSDLNNGLVIRNLVSKSAELESMLPGIRFALESALADLENRQEGILFPSAFTAGMEGIPVNGLIWMGKREFMIEQIREKIERGFRILKIKVGALEFETELALIEWIRSEYGKQDLEIRLDANGAWSADHAPAKLAALARYQIHSIEQPIAPGQTGAMADLCSKSPIPIALDEELIDITDTALQRQMLETIRPAFIILKPGLLGGFGMAGNWIKLAGNYDTEWWVTSALESDVGLNAIAQWTYARGFSMTQGLGTGTLYRNNIPSPLELAGDQLWYRLERQWDLEIISGT